MPLKGAKQNKTKTKTKQNKKSKCVFQCVCAFVKGVNRGHTSDSANGNVDTLPTGDVPICGLPA